MASDTGALRHPGKVAADIEARVAIADTGHHRVVFGHMLGRSLEVRAVIGSGEPGFVDGRVAEARFREPQGLALAGEILIVADRGNHAIRLIDLAAGTVATMAGTGRQGEGTASGGDPLATDLFSPWDVVLHDFNLFIAMGGACPLWRLDLREGRIGPHVGPRGGSGQIAASVEVVPMGLATDDERLYMVDGVSSRVDSVAFEPGADSSALAGSGSAGDRDGVGAEAELRHAAGVAWGPGNHRLWIADTDNHKLKTMDPASGAVETVEPFEETLSAPTGLAAAGHYMLVADTGHDRILRVDQIDKRVVELRLDGL